MCSQECEHGTLGSVRHAAVQQIGVEQTGLQQIGVRRVGVQHPRHDAFLSSSDRAISSARVSTMPAKSRLAAAASASNSCLA